ncbi:MAG: YraN family protein [Raoultibacter sp.]
MVEAVVEQKKPAPRRRGKATTASKTPPVGKASAGKTPAGKAAKGGVKPVSKAPATPSLGGGAAAPVSKPTPAKKMHNKTLGARGEHAAGLFLERRGYEIIERNWVCPGGEADIIARDDDDCLVFIEVKTRSDAEKGFPSEAVTAAKRARYEKIATYYLAQHPLEDVFVRFDVVSIVVVAPERAFIRHHINAFGVGE